MLKWLLCLCISTIWYFKATHDTLFEHLVKVQLNINLAKYELSMATVRYLGCMLHEFHVAPTEARVLAITEYPQPTTKKKKELQCFLGLLGCYKHFYIMFPLMCAPFI